MILAIIADHYLIFAMLFMQLRGLSYLSDSWFNSVCDGYQWIDTTDLKDLFNV